MVELHVATSVQLTHAARPQMLAASYGAIIMVAASLRNVERGRVVCIPGWPNCVLGTLGRLGLTPLLWRARAARPADARR